MATFSELEAWRTAWLLAKKVDARPDTSVSCSVYVFTPISFS